MNKKRAVLLHLAVLAALGIYLFLSIRLRIYCPIKRITGFPCPACGSTRALFSLLRGDFYAYMAYNPFALPLAGLLVLFPYLGFMGRYRRAAYIYCIAVAAVSFVYNIIRIIFA